jgi:hypothetical protein
MRVLRLAANKADHVNIECPRTQPVLRQSGALTARCLVWRHYMKGHFFPSDADEWEKASGSSQRSLRSLGDSGSAKKIWNHWKTT